MGTSAGSRCADHQDEGWGTHLEHKAEHAVDLETGAVVAVTLGGGRFKFLAIPVSKRSVACGESGLRGARRVLPDFAYVCGNSVQEQEAVFILELFLLEL